MTHRMIMVDPVAICVETLRINSRCSLKKKIIELICMNLGIILYIIVKVNSYQGCVYDLLT